MVYLHGRAVSFREGIHHHSPWIRPAIEPCYVKRTQGMIICLVTLNFKKNIAFSWKFYSIPPMPTPQEIRPYTKAFFKGQGFLLIPTFCTSIPLQRQLVSPRNAVESKFGQKHNPPWRIELQFSRAISTPVQFVGSKGSLVFVGHPPLQVLLINEHFLPPKMAISVGFHLNTVHEMKEGTFSHWKWWPPYPENPDLFLE